MQTNLHLKKIKHRQEINGRTFSHKATSVFSRSVISALFRGVVAIVLVQTFLPTAVYPRSISHLPLCHQNPTEGDVAWLPSERDTALPPAKSFQWCSVMPVLIHHTQDTICYASHVAVKSERALSPESRLPLHPSVSPLGLPQARKKTEAFSVGSPH